MCSRKAGEKGPVPPRAFEPRPTRLGAAGDHQVVVICGNARGGEVHGLLRRAALAVDRRGRHRLGQSGGHPGVAGQVRPLLTYLADTATDDIVNALRVHAGALEERREREAQQVRRVPVGQRPPTLAECGPDHIHNDGLSHAGRSFVRKWRRGQVRPGSRWLGRDLPPRQPRVEPSGLPPPGWPRPAHPHRPPIPDRARRPGRPG